MGSTFYSNRLDQRPGRRRKKRPKTFKSEESAKKWAEENKISKYELVNLKPEGSKSVKIKVVPAEGAAPAKKPEAKAKKPVEEAPAEEKKEETPEEKPVEEKAEQPKEEPKEEKSEETKQSEDPDSKQ
jgi:ribonuclease E